MNKKPFIIPVGVLCILVVCALYYCLRQSNEYTRLFVSFDSLQTPSVEVEVEGKKLPLVINLGSKFPLTLNQETLAKITKKAHGTVKAKDLEGNAYEAPAYIIPRIQLGNLTFTDVLVKEDSNSERIGVIGRPLLEKSNLLLDFPNATLVVCNNTDRLRDSGYFLEDMARVPIEAGRTGPLLQAETDMGPLRLVLGTTSTLSLVRTSLLEASKCKKDSFGKLNFTSSKLVIGNKDFGGKTFHLYHISPELHEMDGSLGMDFLKRHAVYLDFHNKIAYISERE